jgi:hypothetical protein
MHFKVIINSDCYIQSILTPVIKKLIEENMYGCFMQNNAMVNVVNFTQITLEKAQKQPSDIILKIKQIRVINWKNVLQTKPKKHDICNSA